MTQAALATVKGVRWQKETMVEVARIRGGVGADGPYWDALEAGEFRLSRCDACRTWLWPAHYRCESCGSWDIGWELVEPRGVVFAWTRNHAVSDVLKARRADIPYVSLLVALPQAAGARVAGILVGDAQHLEIGAVVRGIIRPPEERSLGYATMTWQLVANASAQDTGL